MRAAVTEAPGRMSIRDDAREPGAPGTGEVVVRPEAVGICGSDFHFYAGELHELVGATLPRVQGHEVAAVVEAVGPECREDLVPGGRVALWPLSPCGTCRPCRLGRANVCERFSLIGIHTDGGLQERLTMPHGQVFPIRVERPEVAALAEPVSIAVRAVNRGRVAAGERAVVFGAGPIGQAIAVAALERGAAVLLVDPLERRLEIGRRAGADAIPWTAAEEVVEAARDWAGDSGPPVVLDATGAPGAIRRRRRHGAVGGAGRHRRDGAARGRPPHRQLHREGARRPRHERLHGRGVRRGRRDRRAQRRPPRAARHARVRLRPRARGADLRDGAPDRGHEGRDPRTRGSRPALTGLGLAHLRDRGVDVGDREAVLLLHHLAALRRRGPVGVVRDVQRPVAVVPGLAEDVGLEVLHGLERGVDRVGGEVALHLQERARRDGRLDEAHLAEGAERDLRRVLLQHVAVELAVGPVRRRQVQLRVDAQLAVPLRAERVGEEVRVTRRRARPLHAVLEAEALRGLEDLQRLRRREVQDDAAARARRLHELERDRVRVLDRDVVLQRLGRDAGVLGDEQEAAGDVAGAGHVRLVEDQLLDLLADQVLRRAVDRVARAHVHRGAVRGRVALGRDARVDDVEALLLVVLVVDGALDDRRVADDAEHLLALDQLARERGDLAGVGLLGLDRVVDRAAVDAAVVVDAVEVRLRGVRDVGEVRAGLLGGDAAELDRRARRLLAVAEAALRGGRGRLARGAGGARRRRAGARARRRALVAAAAGGHQEREGDRRGGDHRGQTDPAHRSSSFVWIHWRLPARATSSGGTASATGSPSVARAAAYTSSRPGR